MNEIGKSFYFLDDYECIEVTDKVKKNLKLKKASLFEKIIIVITFIVTVFILFNSHTNVVRNISMGEPPVKLPLSASIKEPVKLKCSYKNKTLDFLR